jgi:hypothetical protein
MLRCRFSWCSAAYRQYKEDEVAAGQGPYAALYAVFHAY